MQFRAITLQLDDIHEVRRLAAEAQAAGFSMAWAIDTPRSDVFVHMAAMATATQRLQIGSGIARAFVRGPLQTAAGAADIDRLSNGQCVLGLASGTMRQNLYEVGQAFEHPATRLKELIGILRGVWAQNGEGRFEHEGRFWKLQAHGDTLPRPLRPRVPVFVGAVNDGMLRMSGEVADGLCGHPLFSVRYLNEVVWPQIDIGLRRAGRSRDDFRMTTWLITCIAADRKQARREAAFQIGFYGSTRSYAALLDRHGWERERAAIQQAFHSTHDMEAVADAVSDDMIDQLALAGTPDDVRRQLRRYDDVLTFPTLYTAGVGPSRSVPQERVRENLQTIIEVFAQ